MAQTQSVDDLNALLILNDTQTLYPRPFLSTMRPCAIAILLGASGLQHAVSAASQTYAATLAEIYSLPTSTSLPFPTATIPAPQAQSWITAGASPDNLGWSLSKGRLQNGENNLAFVADPFPSASLVKDPDVSASNYADPVLQVTYPAGSYSNHTGGSAYFVLGPVAPSAAHNAS